MNECFEVIQERCSASNKSRIFSDETDGAEDIADVAVLD